MRNRFVIFITVIALLACSACPCFAAKNVPDAPVLDAVSTSGGIRLTWTQADDADGYYIYSQKDGSNKWEEIYKTSSRTTLKYIDMPEKNTTKYRYKAVAYNEDGQSVSSNIKALFWIKPPVISSIAQSGNFLSVMWEPSEKASGYELQYCKNRFFASPGKFDIPGSVTIEMINTPSATRQYYVRIRSYITSSNGTKNYSPWTLSENNNIEKNASISILKFNGEKFEIRKAARTLVGYYDTLQGGCITSKYGYFVLYNRNVGKCKIAKFDMKTGKLIKLSRVLNIDHGNDLTYNPDSKVLVAIHGDDNGRKVSIIDPETLKVTSTKTIRLDKSLPGLTESRRTSFAGIGAIAYNTKYDQYVARIKNLKDFLYLDKNLKPVRYVRPETKDYQTYQGMDTSGDYILVGQSFKDDKPYNIISLYDWDGNYISKINVKKGYELESLYHTGNKFYAGFYTSYYETYYVDGFKIKKVRGKNVKVKTKLKRTRLQRVNYIYNLGNI